MGRIVNLLWLVALGAAWYVDSVRSLLVIAILVLMDIAIELKAARASESPTPVTSGGRYAAPIGGGASGGASLTGYGIVAGERQH